MVFPNGGPLPRYPSQLLELFLEGIVLFLILWFLSRKQRPRLFISANFLLWYGLFRFISEFFSSLTHKWGICYLTVNDGATLIYPYDY